MSTVSIKGKEYKIKPTIRAMFLFEEITKKSFKIETLLDNYVYFYSLILANNDEVLEWDNFIDALDEDPTIYTQLNNILVENAKVNELLDSPTDTTNGELKKN